MIIRQEHIPHPWPLWQDTAGSHSVPDWVVALTILSLLSNLAKSGLSFDGHSETSALQNSLDRISAPALTG